MAAYENQQSTVRLSYSSQLNSESTQTSKYVPPRQSSKGRQKRSQSSSIQNSTVRFSHNQRQIGRWELPWPDFSLHDKEFYHIIARSCYNRSEENSSDAQRLYPIFALGAPLPSYDRQDPMYDIARGQQTLLNVDTSSSWHADIVNMREPQKAKFYCQGCQSLSEDRSWKTQSLDCISGPDQPFEGDENAVTALHEEDICERGRVDSWKNGPGRKKEWRSIRYLTSKRKRKRAEYPVLGLEHASKSPSKAARIRLLTKKAPWQIAVPRNMLMQQSSSYYSSPSYSKPRSSMQIVRDLGLNLRFTYTPRMWDKGDLLLQDFPVLVGSGEGSNFEDEIIDDRGPSNTLEATLYSFLPSTQLAASGPRIGAPNAKTNSLNHLIPYEAFIDAILGGCLRLKGLLRTESHYEVYAAESLSDRNQKFEVRAYILRGLAPRERNYRIRNLKRASAHPSFIASLDQVGKKWLVFACCQDRLSSSPPKSHDPFCSTGESYAGEDYESAFPTLDTYKSDGYKGKDKEGSKTDIAAVTYDHNFEKAFEEELLTKLDAAQALDVVDRLRERVVAWFKPCPGGQKDIMKLGERTKTKSPEQLQRARDRQRLIRQAKRLAKTPYVDSQTASGTINRVAGPEVEHASKSKYKDVATSCCTDNLLHMDCEKRLIEEISALRHQLDQVRRAYDFAQYNNRLHMDCEKRWIEETSALRHQLDKARISIDYYVFRDSHQQRDNLWVSKRERSPKLLDVPQSKRRRDNVG